MVLWETIATMIAATICLLLVISVGTESILNAIDKYKTKQAAKAAKAIIEVVEALPDAFGMMAKKVKEIDEKVKEDLD